MKRKNMTAEKHINKKMNNDTYKLRREVMKHIYRAKELLNGKMERVDVRITDTKTGHENVLGSARMKDNIVWIPEKTLSRKDIKAVVFHELLHALFGIQHNDKCPLMGATVTKITDSQVEKLFVKYSKGI